MRLLSRIAGWVFVMVIGLNMNIARSQHLSSARGIAVGAYTSLSAGPASLDWNPSGLVSVRDWELGLSSDLPLNVGAAGLTLRSTSLVKRFLEDHAVAVSYAPEKFTELVIPTSFRFSDSNVVVQTTFDKKIHYAEPYGIGYAYRPAIDISLGVAARFVTEKVTDTQYYLDSNSTIRSRAVDVSGSRWSVDLGGKWVAGRDWRFGVDAKNLFQLAQTQLPEDASQYRLTPPRLLCLGIGFTGVDRVQVGFDADTERRFRAGVEWTASSRTDEGFLRTLCLRAGVYADQRSVPFVEALACGIGGTFDAVDVDASYLRFISQTNRTGAAGSTAFDASLIKDVEYNPFTSDRISLTLKVRLGRTRDPFIRIDNVQVLGRVHPAASMLYAYNPLGTVYVRNVTDKPVEARVQFFMDKLMDAPTESRGVVVAPGERAGIPFYAIFNDDCKSVGETSVREGTVVVTMQPGSEVEDRVQTHVVVRGRNDWDGDASFLKYFVTPADKDVLNFTRSVLLDHKEQVDSITTPMRDFVRARIVFDEFAKRLTYVHDPRLSQDFVQYPEETLKIRGGDCDDMTVCYSTLLMSMGMSTAFVDVVPPTRPSEGHIYMMFDTGIEVKNAQMVSDNPKRYIVRKNAKGIETVWVPVETTVITKGFEEAWSVGATEYYDDVEVNLGLSKGWVRIIDVPPAL